MQVSTPREAFSAVASGYDDAFSRRPHVLLVRMQVQALMKTWFPPKGVVLELGCGTGEDALFLKSQHFRVIASDISLDMLRTAKEKSSRLGYDIDFLQLAAESLQAVKEQSCNAILSNFGGLNCVEDIDRVLNICHGILQERGVVILCLMNNRSFWKMMIDLSRGRFPVLFLGADQAGVNASVGTHSIRIWYHSIHQLKHRAGGRFTIRKIVGLNILTPPPGAVTIRSRHPVLMKFLESIERRIASFPLLSRLGDHFVIVLERCI
jgi:ubiquinone/menaquinone biosynthesis C-methylase UbiE